MNYPRPGEPIVPRLLRSLVLERHPNSLVRDFDGELIARDELGADAWKRHPPEICRRVSLLIVDRVQTRLRALPDAIRDTLLPTPEAALALPLERRTINTLRRAGAVRDDGEPWTVGRYLAIRRFGGRALVDLLAAFEARTGVALPALANLGLTDDRALKRLLLTIARRLPIAEHQLDVEGPRVRNRTDPIDVASLLKSAAQLGHEFSFRVIELGGTRVIVHLRDLTAARAAYRIAVRTVHTLGAATVDGIAGQVRATTRTAIDANFVEGLLSGLPNFRWLDRDGGWFWFMQRSNPLVANLRKVLSVVPRLSLPRMASVLFRMRAGPRPSPTVVQGLCRVVPEVHVADGMVTVDKALDRRAHLNEEETRVVRFLETTRSGLSDAQLRWLVRDVGLAWTPVWRLLRSSPLFEQSPEGLFRLVGSS
jgi:hypothetical protein